MGIVASEQAAMVNANTVIKNNNLYIITPFWYSKNHAYMPLVTILQTLPRLKTPLFFYFFFFEKLFATKILDIYRLRGLTPGMLGIDCLNSLSFRLVDSLIKMLIC